MALHTSIARHPAIAAVVGITAISLLAALTWRISQRQPVAAEDAAALAQQADLNIEQMQGQLTDRLEQNLTSEEQARMDSPMGQAMLRQCLEWSDFHDSHPSEENKQNRDAACARHRDFVRNAPAPQ